MFKSTIIIVATVLAFVLISPSLLLADPAKPAVLINQGVGQIDESRDSRYQHGCINTCFYQEGRCGWGKAQGDTPDIDFLCGQAEDSAYYACYISYKWPVKECKKYKSW